MPLLSKYLLRESKKRDYSCLMISAPAVLSDKLVKWSNGNIPDSYFSYEGDDEPRCKDFHITVIFGLHINDASEVENLIPIKPFNVKLGKISIFDGGNYQVLKIEVNSPELVELHNLLKDNLENTQTHKTYSPHLTLGYLKQGKSDEFIGCNDFDGESFVVDKYIFSNRDGDEEILKL